MRVHFPHLDPHRSFKKTQEVAHTVYFALVFFEGHSMYAYAAGSLFLMAVVGIITHEEV